MRTNKLIVLTAAALLLVNCAHKEIEVPYNTASAVAVMESESTKSNATDEGFFTWSNGDQITIHSSNGNLTGTLSDGDGTPNGTFFYTYFDGQEPTGYAMYPHSAKHAITENTLTFDMPATYNLGATVSNTNAPMIARPAAAKGSTLSFNFSHLGGVFRFVFKNAPAGTDKFTLSLGGSKINGSFAVDLTADKPQITSGAAGDGEGLTTLTFDPLASAQDITLFVPVPTGNYTGIEAKLYKGATELGTWGTPTAVNNINRSTLKLMSAINFGSAGGNITNEQQVATPTQLADAVVKGGTIKLTEDIAITEEIVIPAGQEVVIDLNGNDLNGTETIQVAEGAHLTIVNNGEPVAVRSASLAPSASIVSDTDIIKASENSVITIGEGVSLTTTGANCCCIWIPDGAENVTVNTAGNLTATTAGAAVISHNGNLKTGTINITGGSVTHEADVAVYIAGNADVTISGDAVITGTTAIEQRAGTLTVNGGTFIATADAFVEQANGNGSTSEGVAVAICKHHTDNNLTAVINNGSFSGKKTVFVNNYDSANEVSVVVNGGTFTDLSALKYVSDGATLALGSDASITEQITVTENVTIDLNGYSINATNLILVGEGKSLSIVNSGASSAGIYSNNEIIKASANSTINIGEGVNLTTTGKENSCIWIPDGAENVTVNTAGNLTVTTAGSAVISHNGNLKTGTINITGGSVTHEADVAVYIAGKAEVTISGDAAITGTTAIEQRAGNLTINGGTFVATGDFTEVANNNGTTTTGVAVAVCQHSTNHDTHAVINGGTFSGARNVYMKPFGDNTNVSLVVNGGTFTDPTPSYYLGADADITINMNSDYTGGGFAIGSGQKVTLNMADGVTYNVTAPLVGSTGTQTLGFQFKNGSAISISGGTITSSEAKMLINNYTNLTLNNVTLNPSVPSTMNGQTYYVLSNNSGTVNINGSTKIIAPTADGINTYAFDVCKYLKYPEPTIIWNSTGVVDGSIEMTGGTLELNKDLTLTGVIEVKGTSVVNLNDFDITSGGDVFDVTGNLTVNGTDAAKVTAKSGAGSTCAVWVHKGGYAKINGGYYSVGADKDGDRNDCIYAGSSAGDKGTIDIYAGVFEYTGPRSKENAKDGDLFLLNGKDKTGSLITVYGGQFKNHVPGLEPTGTADSEEVKVAVAEGKKVYNGDTEATVAHSGETDVWYTVK